MFVYWIREGIISIGTKERMITMKKTVGILILIAVLMLSACGGALPAQPSEAVTEPQTTEAQTQATEAQIQDTVPVTESAVTEAGESDGKSGVVCAGSSEEAFAVCAAETETPASGDWALRSSGCEPGKRRNTAASMAAAHSVKGMDFIGGPPLAGCGEQAQKAFALCFLHYRAQMLRRSNGNETKM